MTDLVPLPSPAEAWARLVTATTEFGIAFARWDAAVRAYGDAKRRESDRDD